MFFLPLAAKLRINSLTGVSESGKAYSHCACGPGSIQNIKIKYDREGKKKERKVGGRKGYNPLILKLNLIAIK